MLSFPATLIPNYIKIDQLSTHKVGLLTPSFDNAIGAVQLSGQLLPARLTLQFRSLPVNRLLEATCYNPRREGWETALAFYQLTKSGAIEFDLVEAHPAWTNATQKFLGYSWRITNVTQSGNIVGDFDVSIAQSRAYAKKTIKSMTSISDYPGNALLVLVAGSGAIPLNRQEFAASSALSNENVANIAAGTAIFKDDSSIQGLVQSAESFENEWAKNTDTADYTEVTAQTVTDVSSYYDGRGISDGYEYNYSVPKWYDIVN